MTNDWYSDTGFDQAEAIENQRQAQKDAPRKPWRYNVGWKPGADPKNPDNKGTMVFVGGMWDAEGNSTPRPFTIREHEFINQYGRPEHATCRKDLGSCPFCDGGNHAYTAGIFTVLDLKPRVGKDGTVYVNDKKLLVAKTGSLRKIASLVETLGDNILGQEFVVQRTESKAPRVGDQWIPVGAKDLDGLLDPSGDPADLEVLDYMTIFAPMTEEEMGIVISASGDVSTETMKARWGGPPKAGNTGNAGFTNQGAQSGTIPY